MLNYDVCMEVMDAKKMQEEIERQTKKAKPGWAFNEYYLKEFIRICDARGMKYGDAVDHLIKDFVHKNNPKFK